MYRINDSFFFSFHFFFFFFWRGGGLTSIKSCFLNPEIKKLQINSYEGHPISFDNDLIKQNLLL